MLVNIPENCHFTIYNIPFGVFSTTTGNQKLIGTAIGQYAVDLFALVNRNVISLYSIEKSVLENSLSSDTLNKFMELGKPVWTEMRQALISFFSKSEENFPDYIQYFFELNQVTMQLPISIGDYTDFYASKEHASNVGEMFRGKDNALMPNWLHLPVGYHGRASSIVVSGTPVKRPSGQSKPPDSGPKFGPSKKLDFELEMAFVIGKGNALGTSIPCEKSEEHIFGVCLMNDWSARDIQAWEYVPLGPFLGKSFCTTLSPWIVTLDALKAFLVQGPEQLPVPLDYLCESPTNTSYDVALSVEINNSTVCNSNLKYLYWSFSQQLAHHTINGCNMRTGDICGTGTISGQSKDSYGSMLELSWNGTQKVILTDGSERTYLNDGDEVKITGFCKNGDISLGFGECVGRAMAGQKHETWPQLQKLQKIQVHDGYHKKNLYDADTSDTFDQKFYENIFIPRKDDEKDEEMGVHYYTLTVMNESNKICFRSYTRYFVYEAFFCILSIIMLGIPFLFLKWWPSLKCKLLMKACSFSEAKIILAENSFNQTEILEVSEICHPSFGKYKKFVYRYVPFFIEDGSDDIFSSKDIDLFESFSTIEEAINDTTISEKTKFFLGKNLVDLEEKTYFRLFVDEVAHPFNVFQMASVLIWLFEDYYLYSFSIFLISIFSIGVTLFETRSNSKKFRDMSKFHCKIKILKKSKYIEIDSSDLAPGHVVALDNSLSTCPCDLIIIKGDAIVDESMLTGESVAISKVALQNCLDFKPDCFNYIYCGTRILRARDTSKRPALGLVVKTGFETEKGQLIQSILFPKPINFNFYSDSMKYIFILGIIAIVGFVLSLYNQLRLKTSSYYVFSRALDLITVVVPPALPATMSIGTLFSINRLKKKLIHCISPSKINVASNIDVFCFDKTGTLTEEGLDLFGVISYSDDRKLVLCSTHYIEERQFDSGLHNCMALCHSLQKIDSILVGDPLEVKMFESSKWILEENHGTNFRAVVKQPDSTSETSSISEFGIIKSFEFCSELRRASVLTSNLSSDSFIAYCKGSPESILKICDPSSITSEFESVLLKYSKSGFRVIGCAEKIVTADSSRHSSYTRDDIECNMRFVGFLVFENRLKKQSPKAIFQLAHSNIKTLMVTGDNILTSICVSRSCGIIKPNERVLLPVSELALDSFIDYDSNTSIKFHDLLMQPDHITFACTGTFLKLLISLASSELSESFIKRCKVFARMSPKDKKMLVEFIQRAGLTVGFCGDGANDCGALKAADIGISLSESEASVAAPFSSNVRNISCVIDVLLEGRASLATSFSCFKFMALYSMIQFTSLILLYSFGSSLGDNQFVFIDLVLILPLGMLMSRFQPSQILVPKQPEAKLISPSVLISLLSQILYQGIAQIYIFVLVVSESLQVNRDISTDGPNTENSENSAVFLFSIFLYLFAAALFCSWRPFRSFYAPFYVYVLLSALFALFIIFSPFSWTSHIFELVPVSFAVKKSIIVVSFVYLLVSVFTEKFKPQLIRYFSLFLKYKANRRKPE